MSRRPPASRCAHAGHRTAPPAGPLLAEYHVAVDADVGDVQVHWLDRPDPHVDPMGDGIGEIGIVGTAAAASNAVHHATGERVRDLPITLDNVLDALP
jgi:xanthine dehydrogenase YagR molybdenum-binding subunit